MNTSIFVMVGLVLSGIGIAYYMDWLSLWVGKEELNLQLAESRMSMQRLKEQNSVKGFEPGARASVGTSTQSSEIRTSTPVA